MQVPFVGYVRDTSGLGISDALVEAYAITDLNLNTKSANPLVTGVYPDAATGRWSLFVETNDSPTGYISIKISRGDTVRWIEGDAVISAQRFFADHGRAPILNSSITDAHLGSRTISQTTAPTGNAGTFTSLIGGLANRIKEITGKPNWWTAPDVSLQTLWQKFLSTSTGHRHTGVAGEGPKLDPATALTWLPARATDVGNFETLYTSSNTNFSISSNSSELSVNRVSLTLSPGMWYVTYGANLTASSNVLTVYLFHESNNVSSAYVGFGLGATGMMHAPAMKTVRIAVGGSSSQQVSVRARASTGGGQCDRPFLSAIKVS